ncbi:MAG: NAD(P)-dependent alcohol dehydrogenase [Solirubrobacterales bacterium]|nr:NAD(P)-dependent alcohol dehydrogenase [Solirubrobacterales bacterium]MBV9918130.1 NAD(P)-dependent alcohol dehydrogenase [Solirubrobacterales bacterium]
MSATGNNNRAAVLHAAGDIRLQDIARPEPGPREVLVEIRSVGVCGSDVHYYEHGRIGPFVVEAPLILGHESMGVVVDLGPEASRHRVGDRVTLEPGVPCGRCTQCRHGRYNLCPHVQFFATPPVDGAFAHYVAIHEDFAYALPDSLSDDQGALMEPLSVGLWACWKGGVGPEKSVLVTGAGPIGQLAMQVALALGATDVTVTDVNPHRLEVARRSGASRTLKVDDEPLGSSDVRADVLLECSGHPDSLLEGIKALRPAGVAVAVGMGPEEDATVPMAAIQSSEITLTGTFRYANTYPAAIALAASGRVDLDAIITRHFSLEETERALRAGREDATSIKPMVVPGLPGG